MNEFIQWPKTGENIRRTTKMCISGCVHLRSTILGKIAKEKNDKMGIFWADSAKWSTQNDNLFKCVDSKYSM